MKHFGLVFLILAVKPSFCQVTQYKNTDVFDDYLGQIDTAIKALKIRDVYTYFCTDSLETNRVLIQKKQYDDDGRLVLLEEGNDLNKRIELKNSFLFSVVDNQIRMMSIREYYYPPNPSGKYYYLYNRTNASHLLIKWPKSNDSTIKITTGYLFLSNGNILKTFFNVDSQRNETKFLLKNQPYAPGQTKPGSSGVTERIISENGNVYLAKEKKIKAVLFERELYLKTGKKFHKISTTAYYYRSKGNLLSEITFDSSRLVMNERRFASDSKGVSYLVSDRDFLHNSLKEYNERGQLVKQIDERFPMENSIRVTKFEYNNAGLLLSKDIYINNKFGSRVKYVYK